MFMGIRTRFIACARWLPLLGLTACAAPQGLYYWGDYETSLIERYVENASQHTDAYLTQTLAQAQTQQRKVPPGLYADYGFLLYQKGDRAGAIENFKKEQALYPESQALMAKLIDRIQQKSVEAPSPLDAGKPETSQGEPKP